MLHVTPKKKAAPKGGSTDAARDWRAAFSFLLTQEREHLVRQLVGLRHHRRTGLLQDLRTRQIGRFRREVGVHDAAARSSLVLASDLQVADRKLEAAHRGTVGRTAGRDGVERRVERGQGRRGIGSGRQVAFFGGALGFAASAFSWARF